MTSTQTLRSIVRDLQAEVEDGRVDHGEIVRRLEMLSFVSDDLNRKLRRQLRRLSQPKGHMPELPERIVNVLLHGDYAALISRDLAMRTQYLEEIASLHTRLDLLRQPKVGARTVARIEDWLASRGRRLRRSDEDIVAVISSFKVKRRLMAP
jgi:hypothetical protein